MQTTKMEHLVTTMYLRRYYFRRVKIKGMGTFIQTPVTITKADWLKKALFAV